MSAVEGERVRSLSSWYLLPKNWAELLSLFSGMHRNCSLITALGMYGTLKGASRGRDWIEIGHGPLHCLIELGRNIEERISHLYKRHFACPTTHWVILGGVLLTEVKCLQCFLWYNVTLPPASLTLHTAWCVQKWCDGTLDDF